MRFKKQKRHRKAVRFYTACFGFREPFKILCDGTFVHHLLANGIAPADTALTNILGAPVKIFTTRSHLSICGVYIPCFLLYLGCFHCVSLVCQIYRSGENVQMCCCGAEKSR